MYYQKENFNGTYDFRSRFHNGFIMESHIHEYSELLYCRDGSCDILINGRKIPLKDGEFVFIPPNYVHQYHGIGCNVICAVFSNDFIPLFFKSAGGKKLKVTAFNAEDLKEIFEEFPNLDKEKSVLISGYLNLICSKVIEKGSFENASAADGVLYQKVISYIAENFTEDISLKKIAKKFGYNEKYLSSSLHSLTGIHFSDFIAIRRIEYAKELLTKRSSLSVTQISMDCGFSAVNTFNRQFKKLTSLTPTEYKKIYSITKA